MRTSIVARNAALDALGALANNGFINIYSGSQPATPETPAAGTLLATNGFGATAFAAASGGVLAANSVSNDIAVNASGDAGWFRVVKSDGTTPVFDGTVTEDGGGGDMILDSIELTQNAIMSISSVTYRLPT